MNKETLDCFSDWAAILTAIAAFGAWGRYEWASCNRIKKLEDYLRDAKAEAVKAGKKGQFSMIHLMKEVGLTEDEILQASFKSKFIMRKEKVDGETNLATELLFEYDP